MQNCAAIQTSKNNLLVSVRQAGLLGFDFTDCPFRLEEDDYLSRGWENAYVEAVNLRIVERSDLHS